MNSIRNLYCFWFGDGMSENRRKCFRSIVKHSGVKVSLVTQNTLTEYITAPLHEGFQYLSPTHKSDYLRSYFMYYYGGGYTDIKECGFNWNFYFDELEMSDKDFIGSRESSEKDIGYLPAASYYEKLASNGGYIFKKRTSLAENWFNATQQKMNEIYPMLVKNPGTYHARAIRGGVMGEPGLFSESQYPLLWNELLGEIFHKIQYENLDKYLLDFPSPNTKDYR